MTSLNFYVNKFRFIDVDNNEVVYDDKFGGLKRRFIHKYSRQYFIFHNSSR